MAASALDSGHNVDVEMVEFQANRSPLHMDGRVPVAVADDTAEAASKRLGHASPAIAQKVYRRKAERVKPLY